MPPPPRDSPRRRVRRRRASPWPPKTPGCFPRPSTTSSRRRARTTRHRLPNRVATTQGVHSAPSVGRREPGLGGRSSCADAGISPRRKKKRKDDAHAAPRRSADRRRPTAGKTKKARGVRRPLMWHLTCHLTCHLTRHRRGFRGRRPATPSRRRRRRLRAREKSRREARREGRRLKGVAGRRPTPCYHPYASRRRRRVGWGPFSDEARCFWSARNARTARTSCGTERESERGRVRGASKPCRTR